MKEITRRLARVAGAEAARRQDLGLPGLIVWSDAWLAADWAAWDAAEEEGDRAARRGLVKLHAGQRPGPGTVVIEFWERADGPA